MKQYIYLRTSTDDQTPEDQLKDCQELDPDKRSEIVIEKQSAWSDNLSQRPKFLKIRRAIMRGEVDQLIVWDLDRLYRNRIATVEFMRMCYAKNVAVLSYRQKWLIDMESFADKLPPGFQWLGEWLRDLFLNFLGWIAEEESNKRSDRVRKAYQNHDRDDWGRPKISGDVILQVLKLKAEGHSYREIKNRMGKRAPSIGKISQICREGQA